MSRNPYSYSSAYRPVEPPPAPRRRFPVWLIVVLVAVPGAIVILLCAGAITLGVLMDKGQIPDSKVVQGQELSEKFQHFLRDGGFVDPDEQILYFYSAGIFSIEEDGNLLTDRRVISYAGDGANRWYAAAAFDEIEDIKVTYSTSFLEDTEIEITTADEIFYLVASAEAKGDQAMVAELMRRWKQATGGN